MTDLPTRPRIEPSFIDLDGQRLFALEVSPYGACIGDVLYLPPFAEEMNRLRSHASATARALALRGWRCLLLDPYGTGESDGATEDATWDLWLANARAALRWLNADGHRPTVVWGARIGALLAGELAASSAGAVSRLVFWQPVIDGQTYLNQYLRLRVASQLVHDGARETTDSIRQQLASGSAVEIAGYLLTSAMADALGRRKLLAPAWGGAIVDWIEIVSKPEQALPPSSRRWIESAIALGATVRATTAVAPMVWQIHGREDAPALIEATVAALAQPTHADGLA